MGLEAIANREHKYGIVSGESSNSVVVAIHMTVDLDPTP